MDNPFEQALGVLDERGWYKGSFVNPENGREVCTIGALGLATGTMAVYRAGDVFVANQLAGAGPLNRVPDQNLNRARAVLNRALSEEGCQPAMGGVAHWNDDPATSEEDVRLLLKKAAASWEAGDRS